MAEVQPPSLQARSGIATRTHTLRFGREHAIDRDCLTDKLRDPVALQKTWVHHRRV